MSMRLCLSALFVLATAGAAGAQQSDESLKPGDCEAALAEPATPPAPGADGTAPGNAGNTGWSGGTGGSQIGTNPQGAVAQSRTWQPPTARGLDLAGEPEPMPGASNC